MYRSVNNYETANTDYIIPKIRKKQGNKTTETCPRANSRSVEQLEQLGVILSVSVIISDLTVTYKDTIVSYIRQC